MNGLLSADMVVDEWKKYWHGLQSIESIMLDRDHGCITHVHTPVVHVGNLEFVLMNKSKVGVNLDMIFAGGDLGKLLQEQNHHNHDEQPGDRAHNVLVVRRIDKD